MLMPEAELHCTGPRHFGDFCNIFLANIREDQKNSHHLSASSLHGTAYTKSGPRDCLTFTKKLDESLREQLLVQHPQFLPGYTFKLVGEN